MVSMPNLQQPSWPTPDVEIFKKNCCSIVDIVCLLFCWKCRVSCNSNYHRLHNIIPNAQHRFVGLAMFYIVFPIAFVLNGRRIARGILVVVRNIVVVLNNVMWVNGIFLYFFMSSVSRITVSNVYVLYIVYANYISLHTLYIGSMLLRLQMFLILRLYAQNPWLSGE